MENTIRYTKERDNDPDIGETIINYNNTVSCSNWSGVDLRLVFGHYMVGHLATIKANKDKEGYISFLQFDSEPFLIRNKPIMIIEELDDLTPIDPKDEARIEKEYGPKVESTKDNELCILICKTDEKGKLYIQKLRNVKLYCTFGTARVDEIVSHDQMYRFTFTDITETEHQLNGKDI